MSNTVKVITGVWILNFYLLLAFLLIIILVILGIDAFIEIFPTVVFFAFWIVQIDSHRKDLLRKLRQLSTDEEKIQSIANSEFRKSYFVEILVLAVVNYVIMAFKHPNLSVDFSSLFVLGSFTIAGYYIAKKEKTKSLVPVFMIITSSLVFGESMYLIIGHNDPMTLFLYTLIGSIVADFIYLIKYYVFN